MEFGVDTPEPPGAPSSLMSPPTHLPTYSPTLLPMRRLPPFPLWLALVGALACGGGGASPAPAPSPTRDGAPPRFVPIPDAGTVAIVLMANNVDLAYARIAATRATQRDVKALVRRERASHTALNTTLQRLARRLGITPQDDDVSRLLRDQSMPRRDSLRALSGRRFDSAYVANEVRYHRELLVAIDSVFLRSVQHPALESYLSDSLRPAVSTHLAQTERLQTTLAPRK
jgi:putative membrane protein